MKLWAMTAAAAGCLLLGGCDKAGNGGRPPEPHGRYIGVGTYEPGKGWAELTGAPKPKDDAAATLRDDQQIIVVVDSVTGEVRECGDLTGYCLSQNPWRGSAAGTPAPLASHVGGGSGDSNSFEEASNGHVPADEAGNASDPK
jgi:hypothetical protein